MLKLNRALFSGLNSFLIRIKKCGGFVAWNSLGQPHVNGRLAMTRSLGDLDLKSSGVIAEPETKRIKVRMGVQTLAALARNGSGCLQLQAFLEALSEASNF